MRFTSPDGGEGSEDLSWIVLCQALITAVSYPVDISLAAIAIVILVQLIRKIFEERDPPKNAPPYHL